MVSLFCPVYLLCGQSSPSDFTHRRLFAPENDRSAVSNAIQDIDVQTLLVPLLREWTKAKLIHDSWKDALNFAVRVSISSCSDTDRETDATDLQSILPKVIIYQVICERLETVDCAVDAVECFHEMIGQLEGEIYKSELMIDWVCRESIMYLFPCRAYIPPFLSGFTQRRLSAPERDGDVVSATTASPLLREWAKARLARGSWTDAILSAVGVSTFFALVVIAD